MNGLLESGDSNLSLRLPSRPYGRLGRTVSYWDEMTIFLFFIYFFQVVLAEDLEEESAF